MHFTTKSSIRKEKLGLRLALDEHQHLELSGQIEIRLRSAVNFGTSIVALYHPVRGEVNLLPLMEYRNICLPVIQAYSKEMLFRAHVSGQSMEKNSYGILQPMGDSTLCEPEVIVAPLVAFDRRGCRIGYGGGYYDATIAALRKQKKKVKVIGTAFSFQEVDEVPHEAFDVHLDQIITEKETLDFKIHR